MNATRRSFLGGLAVATALSSAAAAQAVATNTVENRDLIAKSGGYAWRRGFFDYMADPADPNYGIARDENGTRIQVVQSYRIEVDYGARFSKPLAEADFTGASDLDMHLYGLAKNYEQHVSDAVAASGLTTALDEYRAAQTDLREIIWSLCEIRAKTPAGIALKVRATAAYAAFGSEERLRASQLLSRAVWEDMGEDA